MGLGEHAGSSASFGVALVLGAVFIRRCMRHRSPIIDLGLLRIRTFSVANSMTVLAAAGFYGYTLINVLFLTQVWQYSVLEAGLAITPGPVVATVIAGPSEPRGGTNRAPLGPRRRGPDLGSGARLVHRARRAAARFHGRVAAGNDHPGHRCRDPLPKPERRRGRLSPGEAFATATGLNSVARQVGAALGVAAVVAILGSPNPLDPSSVASAFDNAWSFSAVCLLTAGVGCLGVSRLRTEDDVGKSPSLGSAARLVFDPGRAGDAFPAVLPRGARPEPAAARPTTPRAESAADFLARAPIFASLSTEVRDADREELAAASSGSGQVAISRGRGGGCSLRDPGRAARDRLERGEGDAGSRPRCGARRTRADHLVASLSLGARGTRHRPDRHRPG